MMKYILTLFLSLQCHSGSIPTYLQSVGMASGQVQIGSDAGQSYGDTDNTVTYTTPVAGAQIVLSLMELSIQNPASDFRTKNQVTTSSDSGFTLRTTSSVDFFKIGVLYLAFPTTPKLTTVYLQKDTLDLENGMKTETHTVAISSSPLSSMECYPFLAGFSLKSASENMILSSCRRISSAQAQYTIQAGNSTRIKEVQLSILLIDSSYYKYYENTIIISQYFSNGSVPLFSTGHLVYGCSDIAFGLANTPLTFQLQNNVLSLQQSVTEGMVLQIVQPQCSSYFNRADNLCYEGTFGCPQAGSSVREFSVDDGIILGDDVWIQINGTTSQLQLNGFVDISSSVTINLNSTITLSKAKKLNNLYSMLDQTIFSLVSGSQVGVLALEGSWQMSSQYILNAFNGSFSIYMVSGLIYSKTILEITNNTVVSSINHLRIISSNNNVIKFILISEDQIAHLQVTIDSSTSTQLLSISSLTFNYTQVTSTASYLAFTTDAFELVLYSQQQDTFQYLQTISSPSGFFFLNDRSYLKFSEDGKFLFVKDSLLLQILKRTATTFLLQNVIELSEDVDGVIMNSLKNRLFTVTNSTIKVYSCQWDPQSTTNTDDNNLTTTTINSQFSATTKTTLVIVIVVIFAFVIVGIGVLKLTSSSMQVSPELHHPRDLGKKHKIQSLPQFKSQTGQRLETGGTLKQGNSKVMIIQLQ